MKRIAILVIVMVINIILLQSAAASEPRIPPLGNPYVLGFFTIAMTIFFFFEREMQRTHAVMQSAVTKLTANDPTTRKYREAVSQNNSLQMQYELIGLVRDQIENLREEGKSQGEIVQILRNDNWDSQVIFIALNRNKK